MGLSYTKQFSHTCWVSWNSISLDTAYLELTSEPPGKGSVLQECPLFRRQSQVLVLRLLTFMSDLVASWVFPGDADGKESLCNAEDPVWSLRKEDTLKKGVATSSSILGLENSMDRGTWQATVSGGLKESDTNKRLTLSLFGYKLGCPMTSPFRPDKLL